MRKSIVFDRDGTLFDISNSYRTYYEDLRVALNENGIQSPTYEVFLDSLMQKQKVWYKFSHGLFSKKSFRKWRGIYHYQNNNPSFIYASAYPGIKETLETLFRRNFKMVLTSGWFGTQSTRKSLEINGLCKFFETVITLDDFIIKKYPHFPAFDPRKLPFRRSVSKKVWLIKSSAAILNVKPEDTIVVGDSPEDIQAGKKVGSKTVALLTGNGRENISAFHKLNADFIIKSVNNLPEILK